MSSPLGHADSGRCRSTRPVGQSVADDALSLSALTIRAHHRQPPSAEQGGVLCRPTQWDSAVPGRERPPSREGIAAPASSQGVAHALLVRVGTWCEHRALSRRDGTSVLRAIHIVNRVVIRRLF